MTAPVLLITAMLFLLLFQRGFLNLGYARYIEEETEYDSESIESTQDYNISGKYIIYNDEKYLPDRFFIFAFASHVFAFILPALFYIRLLKGEGYTKELNIKLPKFKRTSLVLYGLGVLISGTALISSWIYYADGSLALRKSVIDAGGNPVYDISAAIAFVFLPAVCEEVLFRSIMAREYEKYGALCACLVTSAAFAMLHFSLALFPVYFLAGIILYILAKVAESVLFSIIANAGYSFFNIYVWDRLSNVLKFEQNRFIFSFLAAVLFIIFMIAMINKTEKIYFYKAYMNEPMPESQIAKIKIPARITETFLSPTLLAAMLIFFICAVTA